ncbi:MAG: iron ABC transporter permease, partial [Firmicutes bacterium]|nr:iron ABC transporter permease [Bacillota bacterium]
MAAKRILTIFLAGLFIPAFFAALFIGRYSLPPADVFGMFGAWLGVSGSLVDWPDAAIVVLFQVRLPRLLMALIVGSALAGSGTALQGVMRNPLVSPYILGLSAGASFGAALVAAFFGDVYLLRQLFAFLGGVIATFTAYRMARVRSETPVLSLVLSGVLVGAFFTALLSLVQLFVDPYRLAGIIFWMMGGLHRSSWTAVQLSVVPVLLGLIILYKMRWRLNVLSLGDDEARSLGLNVGRERTIFIGVATLLAATAVAFSGAIGWVGLMVPHMARMIVGPDHRAVMPFSFSLGAAFVLLSDTLAR